MVQPVSTSPDRATGSRSGAPLDDQIRPELTDRLVTMLERTFSLTLWIGSKRPLSWLSWRTFGFRTPSTPDCTALIPSAEDVTPAPVSCAR